MKAEIHPTYYPEAKVSCACGESWTTGSTLAELRVDICSNCHPFFTGEQRIVDTEGQVDRFYKRLEARQKYVEEQEASAAAQVSPDRPMAELELGKRTVDSFAKAKITNVGEFLKKLSEGDEAVLEIDGIGRKSLADAKKALRRLGYTLPEDE
ncbi:MAG: 50S ribosomal protein L31 [Anaerolineae bacterium]|nr:50S ribosomal protein L31 [Anaerolineae bacterium]